jgi:hypothetical protein
VAEKQTDLPLPRKCRCACMCNAVLKDFETAFYDRNPDVRPRDYCGKCWQEMNHG